MQAVDLIVIRYAASVRGQPFAWGRTDCGSMARQVIRSLGVVIDAPSWGDEREARAVMAVELPSAVMRKAGLVEVHKDDVIVGDVLVASNAQWAECLHVCLGAKCLSSSVESGVCLIPTRMIKPLTLSAWRVP